MMIEYTPPAFDAEAFHCPYCHTYAHQDWFEPDVQRGNRFYSQQGKDVFQVSFCSHCHRVALWHAAEKKLVFPITGSAPPPNNDMPDDVRTDYEEADSISQLSPRGAAALLRLSIQKLCIHFGKKGKDLNGDIGELVADGNLPETIQQALDTVRVVGNEAVHPGELAWPG
jgi:Domain of unknown function (DUF4145)